MLGADFLRLREGITDPVSAVEPAVEYGVRAATLFPIEEHARAREFLALLEETPDEGAFRRMGELMYESHAGYSHCGLGVPRTNEIVEVVRAAGARGELFGARISGGGGGGAVVVLGRPEAEPRVRAIAESLGAGLVGGSSPGAARFGIRLGGLAHDANVAAALPQRLDHCRISRTAGDHQAGRPRSCTAVPPRRGRACSRPRARPCAPPRPASAASPRPRAG